MKATLVLAALLASSPATLALLGRQPSYNDWSNSKLEKWLQDHKVPNPGNLNTDQLQDLVKKNYDSVYKSWSDTDLSSYASKNGIPLPTGKSSKDRIIRSLQRQYDDSVDSWSDSDLKEWLSDHGIPLPPKPKHQQLLDTVKAHYSSAQSYFQPSYFHSAQKTFEKNADQAFKSWDDSQLKEYLLSQGAVSPGAKRADLEKEARKYYNDAAASARSAYASATSAASVASASATSATNVAHKSGTSAASAASGHAAGYGSSASSVASGYHASATDTLSSAWYAATDAPAVAYDYLSDTYDDAKGYVWSTWKDNDLKSYLVEKGLIKSDSKAKRDDLVKIAKDSYADTVDNFYETWSDNRLRDWAVKHGIVKSKTASTRDELVDIVSRNYYGARDTTYNAWSKNQLRSWLEARGLVKPGTEQKRDDYLKLVSDNYYSLRDSAYETWDDNMLRNYLSSQGADASKYADAKRSDLLSATKDYWYTVNDKVWDTWSDSEMKAWLARNKVLDKKKADGLRRDKLEEALEGSWRSSRETLEKTWKETDVRNYLVSNGWLKSDAQIKRDELYNTFASRYASASGKSSEYLTWSDARIRGWLRDHGYDVPMSTERQELEQKMKETYVSTQGLLGSIQSWLGSGRNVAEHQIEEAINLLKGALGKANPTETGLKGAYHTAVRSAASATASLKAEL